MNDDPEFQALGTVYTALKGIDPESQKRVIEYVVQKLGIPLSRDNSLAPEAPPLTEYSSTQSVTRRETSPVVEYMGDAEDDGISPIALKWMRRSGLTVGELGQIFSLGASEIDLVAKKIPGKSKNARTRSVVLLKGIAAYLSSGAARITDEQIKEACIHYDAFDSPNHAKYLKGIASEVSGSKANGFTLTARGITNATDVIKDMLGKKQPEQT